MTTPRRTIPSACAVRKCDGREQEHGGCRLESVRRNNSDGTISEVRWRTRARCITVIEAINAGAIPIAARHAHGAHQAFVEFGAVFFDEAQCADRTDADEAAGMPRRPSLHQRRPAHPARPVRPASVHAKRGRARRRAPQSRPAPTRSRRATSQRRRADAGNQVGDRLMLRGRGTRQFVATALDNHHRNHQRQHVLPCAAAPLPPARAVSRTAPPCSRVTALWNSSGVRRAASDSLGSTFTAIKRPDAPSCGAVAMPGVEPRRRAPGPLRRRDRARR